MKDIFSYDGPLGSLINAAIDCICLSFLWLVFSLPIFTMGAASTALYYTVHKIFRKEEPGIWKHFWNSFRMNFKQSTVVWLFFLAFYVLFAINAYLGYGFYLGELLPLGLLILMAVVAAVVIAWSCFLFPYLARFQDSGKVAAKNTIYMMIMNFPAVLAVLVIQLAAIALVICVPFGLAFAPVVSVWLHERILEPVFRKYMSAEDLEAEAASMLMR